MTLQSLRYSFLLYEEEIQRNLLLPMPYLQLNSFRRLIHFQGYFFAWHSTLVVNDHFENTQVSRIEEVKKCIHVFIRAKEIKICSSINFSGGSFV